MEPRWLRLEPYQAFWRDDDKDANFKSEVSLYARADPMPTLERMSRSLGIPVGALARYILARWATSGSDGLLEIGPTVVRRMGAIVEKAEAAGTEAAQLDAYQRLAQIVGWLQVPLDNPNWRPGGWGGDGQERAPRGT